MPVHSRILPLVTWCCPQLGLQGRATQQSSATVRTRFCPLHHCTTALQPCAVTLVLEPLCALQSVHMQVCVEAAWAGVLSCHC